MLDGLHWYQVVDVQAVEIRLHKATRAEMELITGAHYRELGAAVLRRASSGEYVCDVYLTSLADKETKLHELKHCRGWQHD